MTITTIEDNVIRRLPGLKPEEFRGKDTENIMVWIIDMEDMFDIYHFSEELKIKQAKSTVKKDAKTFYNYLYIKNNYQALTWNELKHALYSQYEKPLAHDEMLRQRLAAVPYRGVSHMYDYCQ